MKQVPEQTSYEPHLDEIIGFFPRFKDLSFRCPLYTQFLSQVPCLSSRDICRLIVKSSKNMHEHTQLMVKCEYGLKIASGLMVITITIKDKHKN